MTRRISSAIGNHCEQISLSIQVISVHAFLTMKSVRKLVRIWNTHSMKHSSKYIICNKSQRIDRLKNGAHHYPLPLWLFPWSDYVGINCVAIQFLASILAILTRSESFFPSWQERGSEFSTLGDRDRDRDRDRETGILLDWIQGLFRFSFSCWVCAVWNINTQAPKFLR